MKPFFLPILAILSSFLCAATSLRAEGFTDTSVHFYGEVRQISGAQTVLLQSGTLEMTFVNQLNPANRVSLQTELRPIGAGASQPYSYALKVPLAYLPEAPRLQDFLAIGAASTNFKLTAISIDGVTATLPDGSQEFYGLSFASRSMQYRLDLIVKANSTDTDGDGLPDWWEEHYNLNAAIADSDSDLDGDGWSNLEEFNRGSNPALSNRIPQLASKQLFVPESGVAGLYLQLLDSDSPAEAIQCTLTAANDSSYQILVDGSPLAAGASQQLSLMELRAGRVLLAHSNRNVASFSLPLTWSDGGESQSGEVLVNVLRASREDGNDAALWLDGYDLGADGQSLSLWPDRSGNARSASQPTVEYQPIVQHSAADFSVASSAHLFFQDVALNTGDHTVLAAYQAGESSDTAQTVFATNRGFFELAPTHQAISYPGAASYQIDGHAVQGYQENVGQRSVSIFRRTNERLENVSGVSYDGENSTVTAIDPQLPVIGGRRFASSNAAGVLNRPFDGQVHELLIFPTALPEQKLREVHDYLESKWADAVLWDFSTEIQSLNLTAAQVSERQIIRGGHGDDTLGGGAGDDILSGGPGADTLTGAAGADCFVFGTIDTGRDLIADFNPTVDCIDLSALFWGLLGDARNYISVRLDANFSTPVPTLDSVLIVTLADGGSQEIVLVDTVVSSTDLVQMISEGAILMGGLSIPVDVEIALPAGVTDQPIRELITEPFEILVRRSGEGTVAALDVPLGFFEDALGGQFIVDGATANQKRRAVISFARGELTKVIQVRPVPNLDSAGSTALKVEVLPNFKYRVVGAAVERTVTDTPKVWLNVVEGSAVAELEQPARIQIHREGDLSQGLEVGFELRGTAHEGLHMQALPRAVYFAPNQTFSEITITPIAAALAEGAKSVHLKLQSAESYQISNPHETVVYLATTQTAAESAGFERWLRASSDGTLKSLKDLSRLSAESRAQYISAYAMGLEQVAELKAPRVQLNLANGRPEIRVKDAKPAADVSWKIECADSLGGWTDATHSFSQSYDADALQFSGQPMTNAPKSQFFRVNLQVASSSLSSSSIEAITGAERWGISGNATWETDSQTGALTSSGSLAGESSRIIVEVAGPKLLEFEMEIVGAGAEDLFCFYVDGQLHTQTSAEPVDVEQQLTGNRAYLLMWEFKRGSGDAVIRRLQP